MDFDDFPDLVDGADPVTTGTPIDEAFWDSVQAALLGELRGATDPTKPVAQIVDEILAARGAFASLLARLNDWEAQQYLAPDHARNGLAYGNILFNAEPLLWSRGDAAAPDGWVLAAGAIARCGVGQADTRALSNMRGFSMRLTNSGTPAYVYQRFVSNAMADVMGEGLLDTPLVPVDSAGQPIPGYDEGGLKPSFIKHVWCDGTQRARLAVDFAGARGYSEYHPGDSDWHALLVPAGGSALTPDNYTAVECRVETAGAAYFQAGCVMLTRAGLQPTYIPPGWRYVALTLPYIDNPATGTIGYIPVSRPTYILGAQMLCKTAGTVTAPTADLLTPIGGAYASMFVTLPTIATTKLTGTIQECDPAAANYRRRCIRGLYTAGDAALPDNCDIRVDYVDDGGGTLRGLTVIVHALEPILPFNQFRGMTDIGET